MHINSKTPDRLSRANGFLGLHFDFHATADNVPISGRAFRADLPGMLRQTKPDYVQDDCKGHTGFSSYPPKVGNPAPKFVDGALNLLSICPIKSVFLKLLLSVVILNLVTLTGWTQENYFGVREASGASLIGMLYDFKQTQTREKTPVDPRKYAHIVDTFLSMNWDDAVLKSYYKVTRPLYLTEIYIPMMSADAAPKAFDVEKIVAPRMWLVHYKGQIAAPASGRYRFVGYADDWIAVAINQKTVLVSNRDDTKLPQTNWKSSEKDGMQIGNGRLRYGDWFEFTEGAVLDLDVAMGERPGGNFCAFLMIQKEGDVYTKNQQGDPVLPLFQLAAKSSIPPKNGAFVLSPKPWKAVP